MKTDKKILIIPDFLIALKAISGNEMCVNDIHYATQITYSHLHNMKKTFKDNGWINSERQGNKDIISITDKGKSIVEKFNALLSELNIKDSDLSKYRRLTKIKGGIEKK